MKYIILARKNSRFFCCNNGKEKEYEKFRVIQDQKYISSMDEFYNKYLNENKSDE